MSDTDTKRTAGWKARLEGWLARIRDRGGISLTETLVALVLFGAGVLPIAGTSIELGAVVTSVHTRTHALAIAEAQLEGILRQPYDEVADGAATNAGVNVEWAVSEGLISKEVVLVYRYDLRDRVREDTLTAARLLP